MKWFSFLSKPAWESADPAKRAAAVASDTHADLLARIPDLARHDSDADVRKAAVRRVSDLSLLADRARLDASADVRDLARQRLRQFMLDGKTAFEQRQRQILATEDHELLETVATQAPETDMRRAALERIQRPAFILDRCLKDADAQLRLELLDRIEDPAALERIADNARKSDKRLSRLARERLTTTRLKSGDPATIKLRAESICTTLQGYVRERPLDLGERLRALAADWQQLTPAPDETLSRRYQGLADTLQHMLDVAARPEQVTVAMVAEPAEIDKTIVASEAVVVADIADPDLRALVEGFEQVDAMSATALEEMQQRFRSLYARAPRCTSNEVLQQRHEQRLTQLRTALSEQNRQSEQSRHAALAAIDEYAQAIDGGRLSDARSARQRAHALHGALRSADRDGKRLEEADNAFDKLQRWQRWSNDSQRKRLCDEIEASMGSGEHPDALLTRIKTAQTEWAKLDESEREPGQPEAAPGGLTKRFRVLCAKAIAPARPYLEKRSALRSQKRDDVVVVIDAIESALAGSDPIDAQALRKQTIEGLRQIDEVAPQERRKLSERLRAAKDLLDARINQTRADAEAEKRKFISQLRRRLSLAEGADAINAAKDAMAKWKNLPRVDRKTDDALWVELRSVVDPVFEKSQTERIELAAAQTAERGAIDELLAETEALAASDHDGPALDTRMQALQQRWQAIANRSRDDERAFDRHADSVQAARVRRLADAGKRARAEALRLRAALIDLGTAPAADDAYSALRGEIADAALAATDRNALLAHLTAAQANTEVDADSALAELEWDAVLAELLAGVESPAEHLALRKQVQMQRLADKLGGGNAVAESGTTIWLRWLGHRGVDKSARAALDTRIASALQQILDA